MMIKRPLKILGIDPGKRRVGLAIGNTQFKIATAYKTVEYKSKDKFVEVLRAIVKELEIDRIVMGLPRNMDGSEGDSANFSRRIAETIKRELRIKVEFVDERLTTSEAIKQIHQIGKKSGKSKETIDMLSAALILQTYFDKT